MGTPFPHFDGFTCTPILSPEDELTRRDPSPVIRVDGIHFNKVADCVPSKAPGPYREDDFKDGKGPGIEWGICMSEDADWPYLLRFDCDLRTKSL